MNRDGVETRNPPGGFYDDVDKSKPLATSTSDKQAGPVEAEARQNHQYLAAVDSETRSGQRAGLTTESQIIQAKATPRTPADPCAEGPSLEDAQGSKLPEPTPRRRRTGLAPFVGRDRRVPASHLATRPRQEPHTLFGDSSLRTDLEVQSNI
jgi:hypothetical protein